MGCFGDRFTGGELLVAYAAVGVSGIACARAGRFFLVSDLWFMASCSDRVVFTVSACLTNVSCDPVGGAGRCT